MNIYRVLYKIEFVDDCGRKGVTPDYAIYFNKVNPFEEPDWRLEFNAYASFERMNPGWKALSAKLVKRERLY